MFFFLSCVESVKIPSINIDFKIFISLQITTNVKRVWYEARWKRSANAGLGRPLLFDVQDVDWFRVEKLVDNKCQRVERVDFDGSIESVLLSPPGLPFLINLFSVNNLPDNSNSSAHTAVSLYRYVN